MPGHTRIKVVLLISSRQQLADNGDFVFAADRFSVQARIENSIQ
jgi:hypothetical protein